MRAIVRSTTVLRAKTTLCLKKLYLVRPSDRILMGKLKLQRSPTVFTAKRAAQRGRQRNTGFAQSERCVEELAPQALKARKRNLQGRVPEPKTRRWKSKLPP
jgi:hypothetical protein